MSAVQYYTEKIDTPESSAMNTIYYDDVTETMFIAWPNGTHSGYREVSRLMYQDFKGSESRGAFWNRYIYKSSNWPIFESGAPFYFVERVAQKDDTSNIQDPDDTSNTAFYDVTVRVKADSLIEAASQFSQKVMSVSQVS